ncbi:hypothetical protein [Photobacterium sp. J15]|uniref:hypothetical protein n=1 Tax=Photobacterium sp. J15 TaxID=265901 RepID=UPI0007E2EB3F|nr:hypothetical protein [Photobacterium sp. J15]
MNKFKNKHVIIGHGKHVFTNLYIDVLVNKANVDQDKLVFLTIDSDAETDLPSNVRVSCVSYDRALLSQLSEAKSFTLISFTSTNSFVVKDIYDFEKDLIKKVRIYLTDDELDRWKKIKQQKGVIAESKKLHISSDVVELLPRIKTFITLDKAFRGALSDVLGRDDFNIINVRDPFATMPVEHTDKLNDLFEMKLIHDKPENRILLGSKRERFTLKQLISLIKSFNKQGILNDYKFLLFHHDKVKFTRILIDLYCLYLRYVKKSIVTISYPTVTNSLTYTCMIMSCSHFILQPRGGISSARQYMTNGRGIVCVSEGSPNDRELSYGLGLDLIRFSSFDDLAKKIKNNNVDIEENKIKMREELSSYFKLLKSSYC